MAAYIVTIANDEDDGNTSPDDLSLREAVALANADSGADTITFALTAGSTIVLSLGELALSEDVTINGDVNGDHKADITISGNDASRIFNISGFDTDVALRSLTLTDGYSGGEGGAIYAYEINTLSITDTTIKDSVADTMGGGIRVYWATNVSIANSLIANNFAGDEGGGAFFSTATVAMTNTTVFSNFAGGNGGGISLWGPSSINLANCDIVYNIADYEGSDDSAGGGLYVFEPSAGDTSVEIANSLFGNASGGGFAWNDVSGIIDHVTNSAFLSSVTVTSNDGSIVITDGLSLNVGYELADNGGTVETLARGAISVLTNAGASSALPTDVNDVDHDETTSEVLPIAANGIARVTGPEVDIGAVEYDGGASLFDALDALPLLNSNGSPIQADSLFDGDNETIVFVLTNTTYADGTVDMFAAGEIIQANQLLAAAQLAGHPLDVVLICLDGYAGPLPGLSNGARVLHLDDPASAASKTAVAALYETWDPGYSPDRISSVPLMPSYALHRAPGVDSVDAVRSIEPTTTSLGLAGQFQQRVIATHLEQALDATGNAVDLIDSLFPNLTTPVGAYDAVGEFIPDLTFVDQDGEAFSLHSFADGLVVLSTCTVWCVPCDLYSMDLNSISAAVSPVFNFIDLLVENLDSGLTFTADAEQWATKHDLTLPVLTPDGNVPLLENFVRGINLTAFPDYIVMDGATGQIVARFGGYNGVVSDKAAELDAIAEAYYKPVFSSATAASIAENGASTSVVYDANATDKDDKPGSPNVTFSLAGVDAAKFSIEATTGKVRFLASPDFESPGDAGTDNAYDITISANDGVNITDLAVRVAVTDKFEGATTNGNDVISGTAANEIFRGALGNDLLTGKAGVDTFVFDTKFGKSNVDRISDFAAGTDLIQLDRSFFKKLAIGDLKAKAFTAGKVKSDDRIIYNKQSGDLSFDIDGKGGTKAIKFATLDGSPDDLGANDFVVVA